MNGFKNLVEHYLFQISSALVPKLRTFHMFRRSRRVDVGIWVTGSFFLKKMFLICSESVLNRWLHGLGKLGWAAWPSKEPPDMQRIHQRSRRGMTLVCVFRISSKLVPNNSETVDLSSISPVYLYSDVEDLC